MRNIPTGMIPFKIGAGLSQFTGAFVRNRSSKDLNDLLLSQDNADPTLGAELDASQQPPPGYKLDLSYTAVRGILAYKNDMDRYLSFQFNPMELTDVKDAIYEDRFITGFDEGSSFWLHGGNRLISFTLPLDATESSRRSYLGKSGAVEPTSSDLSTHDPTRGVYNQTEFLQSLQRPYVPSDRLPRFIRGASVKVDQFTAPPEAVFVFGNLYLVGYLAGLEIAYSAFNRELVPLRAEARISFKVKESEKLVINPDVTRFANQGFSTNSSRVL